MFYHPAPKFTSTFKVEKQKKVTKVEPFSFQTRSAASSRSEKHKLEVIAQQSGQSVKVSFSLTKNKPATRVGAAHNAPTMHREASQKFPVSSLWWLHMGSIMKKFGPERSRKISGQYKREYHDFFWVFQISKKLNLAKDGL